MGHLIRLSDALAAIPGGGHCDPQHVADALRALPTAATSDAPALTLTQPQVDALREVIRISDRKHDAWDTIKSALSHQCDEPSCRAHEQSHVSKILLRHVVHRRSPVFSPPLRRRLR